MKIQVQLKKGHPNRKMNLGKHLIEELKPREVELTENELHILKTDEVKFWFVVTEIKESKK